MIFHFRTTNVTFFEEDQAYFEEKLSTLVKFLGNEAGDEDTVDAHISLSKNKHESGNRFEAHATVSCAHHGKFHTEVEADNIKKCADIIEDKLGVQMKKFHDKHKG